MFEAMKYVYEVYKESSFSKAAKNMYISQPSLSASIKKEEDRLGVKLFNRNTSPVQLTPPGEAYIDSIKQIMEIENTFQNYIYDFQNLNKGALSIGANNIYTSFLLPQIVKDYHQVYPNIQITIKEGTTSSDIKDTMEKDLTDIALDNFPFEENLFGRYLLFKETLYLIIPKSFKINDRLKKYQLDYNDILASKKNLPSINKKEFDIFNQLSFIGLKKGSDNRNRFDAVMNRYGIIPNIEFELDQSPSAYYIASSGLGATFSSGTFLRNIQQPSLFCFYHVDEPEFHRNVYIYTKKNKYISKSITEFFRIASASNVIKSDF